LAPAPCAGATVKATAVAVTAIPATSAAILLFLTVPSFVPPDRMVEVCSPRDGDAALRHPRHRGADRGAFGLRPPGRRLLRGDRGADLTEVGLGLQSDKRPEEYAELARRAEAAGFDVVSVFHDLLFQPAIFPLLTIAAATERVRLGPAALNPLTLHPVELAGQAAALDLASDGRAYLGLVAGAWLDRLGLDESRPVERMR